MFGIGDKVKCIEQRQFCFPKVGEIYEVIYFDRIGDIALNDRAGFCTECTYPQGMFVKVETDQEKGETMDKFKIGDRVKQIVGVDTEREDVFATVTRVDENLIYHRHDGQAEVNSCSPDWLRLVEQEDAIVSKFERLKIGERITENNKNQLIPGDIIKEDRGEHGAFWFVFERETNSEWFYGWIIFSVASIKEVANAFFDLLKRDNTTFYGKYSYHDAGILPQDYNNHKSYYMGNVYDYQKTKEVAMSKYQEKKKQILAIQAWDKKADDVLQELVVSKFYYLSIRAVDKDKDGKLNYGVIMITEGQNNSHCAIETFFYKSQCEKLDAFKLALLWLLDHSDIKKDDKQEKIWELELKARHMREQYKRDSKKLHQEIDELMG